jgi:hypothetical protein
LTSPQQEIRAIDFLEMILDSLLGKESRFHLAEDNPCHHMTILILGEWLIVPITMPVRVGQNRFDILLIKTSERI